MHRSERRSLMERVIYPLFGMFPWRCGRCRNRVMLQDRGDRRLYVSQGESRRRRSGENAPAQRNDEDAA